MKFKEILNKIFKRNNAYSAAFQTLACLNDIVPMPKREDFTSDMDKLSLIDSYKEEYMELIKQNKTITSIDLMPEYLHKYKNIYTDLLLNLCNCENADFSFDYIEETGDADLENLDVMIKCIKLMLYQQEIATLELNTRLRLIALNELLENLLNGRLFTRIKSKEIINSILCEISNLHSSLIVFLNQKHAMKIESESYLKNIGTLEGEAKTELIYAKLNEVKNMLKLIDEKELNRLEGMNLNPRLFIAIIEQKLEIYVYTHPEILEELKIKVQQLDYEVNRKVNYDFEDENNPRFQSSKKDVQKRKYEFLSQIKELELLYKIFSKYGRNLVIKDDLKALYETKFKILTCDILDVDEINILSNVTFTELECYQEIVFKKIEAILKGKNQNVNFFIPGGTVNCDKSLTDIIGYIAKTLKDGENEFLPSKILQDKKLLSLLLAFDEEDGLADFFEKNYVSLDKYSKIVNFYNEYFSWWNVPLSTIYRLMRLNIVVGKKVPYLIKYINEYEPLYYLFILYDEYVNISLEYKLPEGLTRVRFHSFPANEEEAAITDYIRKKARKKTIIMPSSLQSVEGALFDKTYSNSIILNDGLERLGINFLITGSLVHVEFPYTLQIFPSAINLAKLKTITIRINQRSIFFEELIDNYLLAQCFKLEETNEIVDIEGNKRDVKEYKIGYIVSRICKLVPTFDELIFINENEKKIIYTKEMLELVTKRKWKIGLPIGWEDPTYLRLTQEEEKLIADKFREIYYDITGQKCIAKSETFTLRRRCLKKNK